MVLDLIMAAGEVLSIVGLLYGAYVSITYGDREHHLPPKCTTADTGDRYDPVTTHAWNVTAR